MRTWTETHREGTDVGPIDWSHPWAKDMPPIWREAEQKPEDFVLDTGTLCDKPVIAIRMYDGWPYWKPGPAILVEGTLGAEWQWFTSYGVGPNSIKRRRK